MVDRYYRGQGSVYLSSRDAATGQPTGGFRFLGNVPMLRISTTTQQIKHQESYTGQTLTDLVIETSKEATLGIQLESFDRENLELAMFGTPTLLPGATVTGETITAYVGRSTPLTNINLTSFSLGSYVEGDDYLINLKTGMVSIPVGSSIADGSTITANYVCGNSEKVSTFTKANQEYWLRFDGLNTAEGDNPVVIDCFKVRFMPSKEYSLIGNELSSLELDGDVLYDALQPDSTADGRFFRVRQASAA